MKKKTVSKSEVELYSTLLGLSDYVLGSMPYLKGVLTEKKHCAQISVTKLIGNRPFLFQFLITDLAPNQPKKAKKSK